MNAPGETPAPGRSRAERLRGRIVLTLAALSGLLALSFALAVTYGAADVQLWHRLLGGFFGPAEQAILIGLRLPRVIAAAAIGGLLAVAGVGFQALLRNPLADPFVIGVSGGASLGGVLALVVGLSGLLVPAAAFGGAIFALVAIERLATVAGRRSPCVCPRT